MRQCVFTCLLVFGCISAVSGMPVAHAEGGPSVVIGADNLCTDRSVKIVALYATATGLMPPLSYHWSLGNGKEWNGSEVPEQEYEVGRYDVLLAVKDDTGRVRKASVAIEAESHGCGVMK